MIKEFKLKNQTKVLIETLPHVKSVSVGYWINAGSIHEKSDESGVSHFIEHMLFKGTTNRTAKEIAASMDNIGGQLNAFTSKECTCFYAKVIDSHINTAIDVISDMIKNPLFSDTDITREKGVVLEEISMYEDSPEDIVHDELAKLTYDGHPLAKPILGTTNSIQSMTREQIVKYYKKHYGPSNLVISVVGNVDENEVLSLLEKEMELWLNEPITKVNELEKYIGEQFIFRTKDIEQFHVCLGFPNVKRESKDHYSMLVLNNILGGSMSSRLFQKIREEMGMVYSIYSYPSNYLNSGMMTIYAGMNPNEALNVINTIINEIDLIKQECITETECYTAKEQLKGNYILSLESTSSRMINYGRSQILTNKIKTQDEILEKINAVTLDDIKNLIPKILDYNKINVSCISNFEENNETYIQIKNIIKQLNR